MLARQEGLERAAANRNWLGYIEILVIEVSGKKQGPSLHKARIPAGD